ncbi:MAG: AAA family ATPase [Magnetovibrionaceae bacterium]
MTVFYDDGEEAAQSDLIAWLASGAPFGCAPQDVSVISTHASRIFRGPGRVLKLKRAVDYGYLNFSTLDRRRASTEAEIRLNRRTAPDLYRGILPVYRGAEGVGFDACGPVVDYLVELNRFDDGQLLSRIAADTPARLDRHLMEDLAAAIAALHRTGDTKTEAGGAGGMQRTLDGNAAAFAAQPSGLFLPEQLADLQERSQAALDQLSPLLEARRVSGQVRELHGDLHLGNIYLGQDGLPVLFDAIDFDPDLLSIDRLYDLAFALMDLRHQGLKTPANILLNRTFDLSDEDLGQDAGGLAALGFFIACRAAIRAHVTAQATGGRSDDPRMTDARSYLEEALSALDPAEPRLIAIGGLSGSGKSRIAREIAADLPGVVGARIIRSDVVRKRLFDCPLDQKLEDAHYGGEATIRTFEQLGREVRAALEAGASVIADAVWLQEAQRAGIEAIATDLQIPFTGLWVEAPLAIRMERAASRRRNVSDATAEIAEMQENLDPGFHDWRRVDSSGPKDRTLAKARAELGLE